MYSIVVRYFPDVQYHNVAIKVDGIYEKETNLKLHTKTIHALLDFNHRVNTITNIKKEVL